MSSETDAVRVEGLGKDFFVYRKPHHRLMQMLARGDGAQWARRVSALDQVSFSVARGETVGIIGRNGSGKSTLLQIIAGIMTPSRGSVHVNGRVAALLELGAGFNPDFTGRENVYVNGAVLGLSRDEIDARFDAIAAFADLGEFLEQPVRTYSSGMYVRLAFAVASSVDADILVVDEALSVGDEAFQRKCFARIERIRDQGATILFVSHGAGTIIQLCSRALLLDAGELLASGPPRPVVARYHRLLYGAPAAAAETREAIRRDFRDGFDAAASAPTQAGDGAALQAGFDPGLVSITALAYPHRGVTIEDPRLCLPGQSTRVNVVPPGCELDYVYVARFDAPAAAVRFGMMLKTVAGLELGGSVSMLPGALLDYVEAGTRVEVRFRFRCVLTPGVYFLNCGAMAREGEEEVFLARQVDAVMFRVLPDPASHANGIVDFGATARLTVLDPEPA